MLSTRIAIAGTLIGAGIAITGTLITGAPAAADAGVLYQAYCDVHEDWHTYSAGNGAAWGHSDQDWLGECRTSAAAANADAIAHDERYHVNRDQYQAAVQTLNKPEYVEAREVLGLEPHFRPPVGGGGPKRKAGVKALDAVDCSSI